MRWLTSASLLAAVVIGAPRSVHADVDVVVPPSVPVDVSASGQEVAASVFVGADGRVGGSGVGRDDRCHWERWGPGFVVGVSPTGQAAATTTRIHHGREQVAVVKVCDGDRVGFGFAYTTPLASELIADIHAQVRRRLPTPVPAINPPDHGIVNLAMWLAVDAPGDVTAATNAAGYSASVTATLASTTFELDGDTVDCDGPGTPITDLDTLDAGPCTFTFTRPHGPDDPARITITQHWDITYATTIGDGTLPALTTSTSFDYQVWEITTIGHRG